VRSDVTLLVALFWFEGLVFSGQESIMREKRSSLSMFSVDLMSYIYIYIYIYSPLFVPKTRSKLSISCLLRFID
jgi:hypothetical protein